MKKYCEDCYHRHSPFQIECSPKEIKVENPDYYSKYKTKYIKFLMSEQNKNNDCKSYKHRNMEYRFLYVVIIIMGIFIIYGIYLMNQNREKEYRVLHPQSTQITDSVKIK